MKIDILKISGEAKSIEQGRYAQIIQSFRKRKEVENQTLIDLSNKEFRDLNKQAFALILKENEPKKKDWNFENNIFETKILFAWFCRDKKYFNEVKKEFGRTDIDFNKNFYLFGEKGSGKSSTVFALNDFIKNFAKKSDAKQTRQFNYTEQNKMSDYFSLHQNINAMTYNLNEKNTDIVGLPTNIILDDLRFDDNTQSFGTTFKELLIQFLYARHSVWQFQNVPTIITSLIPPAILKKELYPDLYDRFVAQYNILTFKVNERIN